MLTDTPVDKPADDSLGRGPYADALAGLILNAPDNSSFRLGVYGDWGEGKTSVLGLVAHYLRERGHVTIWLPAWLGKSQEELELALLKGVADELGLSFGVRAAGMHAERASSAALAAADLHPLAKAVGALAGDALQKMAKNLASKAREDIFHEIYEHLEDKKLIVFVDDLDRVDAALLPRFLLSVRELWSYPNFFYVLALSPRVVEEGLKQSNLSWGEAGRFLEKIIEYPTYLPPLTGQALAQFVLHSARDFGAFLTSDLVRDLVPLFPNNPRRAKLFLRLLVSMQGQLSRFAPEELDWVRLCLAQMLAIEFPKQSRAIIADKECLADLQWGTTPRGVLLKATEGRTGTSSEAHARALAERYAPQPDDGDRQRFLSLYEAIRERSQTATGRYGVRQLLLLNEEPALITWKEANDLLAGFAARGTGELEKWLRIGIGDSSSRAVALFGATVDLRNAVFEQIRATKTPEQFKAAVGDLRLLTNMFRALIGDLNLFGRRELHAESWGALFNHCYMWSAYPSGPEIDDLRSEMNEFMKNAAANLSSDDQAELLGSEVIRDRQVGGSPPSFQTLARQIERQFQLSVVDNLLRRFERADGIDSLLFREWREPSKQFLFDPKSPFHEPDARARLTTLAQSNERNPVVQLNFLAYLLILVAGATAATNEVPQQQCKELLTDTGLISIVWEAATAKPLSDTILDRVRESEASLKELGIPAELIRLPAWFVERAT